MAREGDRPSTERTSSALSPRRDYRLAERSHGLASRVASDLSLGQVEVGVCVRDPHQARWVESAIRKCKNATPVRLPRLSAEDLVGHGHVNLALLVTDDVAVVESAEQRGQRTLFVCWDDEDALTWFVKAWDAGADLAQCLGRHGPLGPGGSEWMGWLTETIEIGIALAQVVSAPSAPRLVLWAEDEQALGEILIRVTEVLLANVQLQVAQSVTQALEILDVRGHEVDLIVSDFSMGPSSGAQFFDQIAPSVRGRIPLVLEDAGGQLGSWSQMGPEAIAAVQGWTTISLWDLQQIKTMFERGFAIRDAMQHAPRVRGSK